MKSVVVLLLLLHFIGISKASAEADIQKDSMHEQTYSPTIPTLSPIHDRGENVSSVTTFWFLDWFLSAFYPHPKLQYQATTRNPRLNWRIPDGKNADELLDATTQKANDNSGDQATVQKIGPTSSSVEYKENTGKSYRMKRNNDDKASQPSKSFYTMLFYYPKLKNYSAKEMNAHTQEPLKSKEMLDDGKHQLNKSSNGTGQICYNVYYHIFGWGMIRRSIVPNPLTVLGFVLILVVIIVPCMVAANGKPVVKRANGTVAKGPSVIKRSNVNTFVNQNKSKVIGNDTMC